VGESLRMSPLLMSNKKTRLDKSACSPERTKVYIPSDIVISLLRPDELEKLRKYIASYLGRD
jgi:hypothetical protein